MTLPAMRDEQIRTIFRQCERAGGYLDVQDVARAIIAARDAQWQAANDTLAAEVDRLQAMLSNVDCKWQAVVDEATHEAFVKGQRDAEQYAYERTKRETEVLRAERDQARQMSETAMNHIASGASLQIPNITLQGPTQQDVQVAVDAAVMAERERIADWYSVTGWLLDEDDVPDAIRARTKEKT